MDARDLLLDGISRSQEVCHDVLDGLDVAVANQQPGGVHNSITWLVWHLARQQDVQIAPLAGTDEVWTAAGWSQRFALDLPAESFGFGQAPEEAAKVTVDDTGLLLGYLDAATRATSDYLRGLDPASLDDIIDTSWTPAVTRGVRLVSIVDDAAQHAGQAAYVRGLLTDWRNVY